MPRNSNASSRSSSLGPTDSSRHRRRNSSPHHAAVSAVSQRTRSKTPSSQLNTRRSQGSTSAPVTLPTTGNLQRNTNFSFLMSPVTDPAAGGSGHSGDPGSHHTTHHHSAGSFSTTVPNTTIISTTVPLPPPSSARAPRFRGKEDVNEFIDNIENAGKAAGYSEDRLPALVLRYCSSKVRSTLEGQTRYFAQGTSWPDAKEVLRFCFAKTEDSDATLESLRRFVDRSREIRTKAQFEKYFRKFMRKCGNLMGRHLLTEAEYNMSFYRGLPESIRRRIKSSLIAIADAERKPLSTSNPPPVQRTVELVRKLFSSDDIDYCSDEDRKYRKKKSKKNKSRRSSTDSSSDSSSSSDSDDESESENESRSSRGRSKKVKKRKSNDELRELREEIARIKLAQAPQPQTQPIATTRPGAGFGYSIGAGEPRSHSE